MKASSEIDEDCAIPVGMTCKSIDGERETVIIGVSSLKILDEADTVVPGALRSASLGSMYPYPVHR